MAHFSTGTGLVLPYPGVPLSLELVQKDVKKLSDDTSADKTDRTLVHRDSSGRLRIESSMASYPQGIGGYTDIIDPTIGFRTVLLIGQNIGYRMSIPKTEEHRLGIIISPPPSSHQWISETHSNEDVTMQGYSFKGTRFIQIAADDPSLKYVVDQWYSEDLKLIGREVKSDPDGTVIVQIEKLKVQEPDPELFKIPAQYKVQTINPSK